MKTIFKIDLNPLDFLRDYKKYSKDSFKCPIGFDKIEEFAKLCRNSSEHNIIVSFEFNESIWLNLGDRILLNNIYYRVTDKTILANQNIISYHLDYE